MTPERRPFILCGFHDVRLRNSFKQLERTMNAGPGKSSGAGGRGRRRRGRRPHNQRQGPAQNRQNQDGIYTAPMDHSYRAAMAGGNNGHKGGRQRPGFATQYPQPEPEPEPLPVTSASEDANSRIFAFIEDLFFMAKI